MYTHTHTDRERERENSLRHFCIYKTQSTMQYMSHPIYFSSYNAYMPHSPDTEEGHAYCHMKTHAKYF